MTAVHSVETATAHLEWGYAGRVDLVAVSHLKQEAVRLRDVLNGIEMDDTAPQVREDLDKLQADWISRVVDARGRFMAQHGVGVFAEYFSPFSAGERQLNRAWSALADGHVVVAREAMEEAGRQFDEASTRWGQISTENR